MKEIILFVTAGSEDEAVKIAKALVESKWAACVNIIGNVRSIYQWEGKIEDESEVLMIIKSRADLFEQIRQKIEALHSYSVPEIISFPITRGAEKYLKWLNESVSEKGK